MVVPKFRAWDKNTKKMDGMVEIYRNRKQEIELLPRDDNTILMQFTGLFDKNGAEIFEGDAVSFSIDNGWDYVVSKNGLIIYSDGCYQILENGIKYRINQCLEEDIEVIGNMYELERVEK